MPRGSGSPTSTRQNRIGFLNSASSSMDITRPTTSGPLTPSAGEETRSTSRPTRTSASPSSAPVSPAGSSANSAIQDTGARISGLHSEGLGEPQVALDDVAHVGGVVAEHHGALDPHSEGESRIDLGVDAAGAQHPRVDHPAAAPLDPALAVAGAAR